MRMAASFGYICFTLYHCFFFSFNKELRSKDNRFNIFLLKKIQGVADASGEPSVILAVNIDAVG